MFEYLEPLLDHIANPQSDAFWEGQRANWLHCGKEKGNITSLPFPQCIILEINDVVFGKITPHRLADLV